MAKRAGKVSAAAEREAEERRKPLYAELTPAAYEAWNDFAGRYGCSVTSVLEAIGQQLMTNEDWQLPDISSYPEPVRTMLEQARVIGMERRRRKR